MSDGNNTEVTPEPTQTPDPAAEPQVEPVSNAELKAHPAFQKVTGELAQLRQEKADRVAKEDADKVEAERAKLVAAGDYESALKLRDDNIEQMKTDHAKDLLQRDIESGLMKVGFNNDIFLRDAVRQFDGDSAGVAEYVKELAAKDENKMFMGNEPRTTLPETVPGGKPTVSMSVEEARQLSKSSDDPAIRQKARLVLKADFDSRL
ncbi:hypothetical protein KAR91_53315 [Candidatus Pacearchaeota archaeon]|nr:hypothetical protein [Candidatus Pacearchaeota archaeon]